MHPNTVGMGVADVMREWLDELPGTKLAEHLTGGVAAAEIPDQTPRARLARLTEPRAIWAVISS